MMTLVKTHANYALSYFILAAVLGAVLRSFQLLEIPITYKFLVHTHSHIALLGWVYLALTTLLYKLYLSNLNLNRKYGGIFWFTQLSLVGMLLTFPFMGYALFSIIFSTLFLFASYWFALFFFKNTAVIFKKTNSYKCIRIALWYLVLSSLGPWALGAIMNTLGAESVWYLLSIYFYLHFLYNGWMIMALVGIFFYVLEQYHYTIPTKAFKRFFWTFNLGVLFSFFLSTLFVKPSFLFYVLGGVGAFFQLLAFWFLIKVFIRKKSKSSLLFSPFQRVMLHTLVILLVVKMALQLVTAIPYFANLAATILDFTIGYLHWTFLGVVTLGIFFFFDHFKLIMISKKAYSLYLMGFFITEGLIFYKGIVAWQDVLIFEGFLETLALGSILIPISLAFILGTNLLNKH